MSRSQHDQLIVAGWQYDPQTDRYTAPGAPKDGTAKSYNRLAAWIVHTSQSAATPRRARRTRDPREQEPQ